MWTLRIRPMFEESFRITHSNSDINLAWNPRFVSYLHRLLSLCILIENTFLSLNTYLYLVFIPGPWLSNVTLRWDMHPLYLHLGYFTLHYLVSMVQFGLGWAKNPILSVTQQKFPSFCRFLMWSLAPQTFTSRVHVAENFHALKSKSSMHSQKLPFGSSDSATWTPSLYCY